MHNFRNITLDGCHNIRDLGGLAISGGGKTQMQAMIRSDSLDHLTRESWSFLISYGIRTIIDLRNEREKAQNPIPRPAELTTIRIPLDGGLDPKFWYYWGGGPRFCTPVYYRPHLERFPERSALVLSRIARSKPGGVLFHCSAGRDRTGLITLLLLLLVGVEPENIVADYLLSIHNLENLPAREEERKKIAAFLTRENKSLEQMAYDAIDGLDVWEKLQPHGLRESDCQAIRKRLAGE